MKLPYKLLPLLMLGCAGCVISYDQSDDKVYQPYIGQAVTLTRPLSLEGLYHSWYKTGGDYTLQHARYGLAEPDAAHAPRPLYARLPKGYPATVDRVRFEVTNDEGVTVVYGYLGRPGLGERASFAYKRYDNARPLPWRLATPGR